MNQLLPDYSISMEQEMKRYLTMNSLDFLDRSSSYDDIDFLVKISEKSFALDVKEKQQYYQKSNWPSDLSEQDMFIMDELAVRKCLACSPFSGILVRDNIRRKYVLYTLIDLVLMPHKRVNRSIAKNQLTYKGKWIINLQNGLQSDTLDEAISNIRKYISQVPEIFDKTRECYGQYLGEEVGQGGITRRPYYWNTDLSSTR